MKANQCSLRSMCAPLEEHVWYGPLTKEPARGVTAGRVQPQPRHLRGKAAASRLGRHRLHVQVSDLRAECSESAIV